MAKRYGDPAGKARQKVQAFFCDLFRNIWEVVKSRVNFENTDSGDMFHPRGLDMDTLGGDSYGTQDRSQGLRVTGLVTQQSTVQRERRTGSRQDPTPASSSTHGRPRDYEGLQIRKHSGQALPARP